MSEFNAEDYTNNSLIEELLLIERHAKDGSAAKAKCSCIQDKHLKTVIALAKEGKPLTQNSKLLSFYNSLQDWAEKRLESVYDHVKKTNSEAEENVFYDNLAVEVREWRISLENEDFKAVCGCHGCPPCSQLLRH